MTFRPSFFGIFLAISTAVPGYVSAMAAEPIRCTVIIDEQSGDTLYRQGTCDQDFYP